MANSTLADLRTRFDNSMDTGAIGLVTTIKDQFINDGAEWLYENFQDMDNLLFLANRVQLFPVNGKANLPADFNSVVRIEDGYGVHIPEVDPQTFPALFYFVPFAYPYGSYVGYFLSGYNSLTDRRTVTFMPAAPLLAGGYYLWYTKTFSKMVNPTDKVQTPPRYDDMIINYAMYLYFKRIKDFNRASEMMAMNKRDMDIARETHRPSNDPNFFGN